MNLYKSWISPTRYSSWNPLSHLPRFPGWTSFLALLCLEGAQQELWPWTLPLLSSLGILCFAPLSTRRLWFLFIAIDLLRMVFFPVEQASHPQFSVISGQIIQTQQGSSGVSRLTLSNQQGTYLIRIPPFKKIFLHPGDSLHASVHPTPTKPLSVPGSFDSRQWIRSNGWLADLTMDSILEYKQTSFSLLKICHQLRQQAQHHFDRHTDPLASSLLKALITGDRSQIPFSIKDLFVSNGLIHVLAVSGFHTLLLAQIIRLILLALHLPHRISSLCTILFLIIFIPFSGASPSVQRAVFMITFLECSRYLQRRSHRLQSLGIVMTALILIQPILIQHIGFQLSCSATAGILVALKTSPSWTAKLPRLIKQWIWDPLWITLIASLSTLPLLTYHFHAFPWGSLLANLVVVPLLVLAIFAGFFSLFLYPLASSFCASAQFFLHLAISLIQQLNPGPHAFFTLGPWPNYLVLFLALAAPFFSLICKGNRPALILFLVGALCFLNAQIQHTFSRMKPWIKVTLLDADQGDCIVIQTHLNQVFVMDVAHSKQHGSYGQKILIPFLRKQGVQSIQALFLSHGDADHIGGLPSLIGHMPIQHVYVPSHSRQDTAKPLWQKTLQQLCQAHIPITAIQAGMVLKASQWRLMILHPFADHTKISAGNEASLALRIENKEQQGLILLPGDLEMPQEEEIMQRIHPNHLQVPLLKLGHHGSRHASGLPFLRRIQPRLGLVSAGRKNRYHHPSPQTLERLQQLGIPVLSTAQQGSLQFRYTAHSIQYRWFLNTWSSWTALDPPTNP